MIIPVLLLMIAQAANISRDELDIQASGCGARTQIPWRYPRTAEVRLDRKSNTLFLHRMQGNGASLDCMAKWANSRGLKVIYWQD